MACAECHGEDFRGRNVEDGPQGPDIAHYADDWTAEEWRDTIRTGVDPEDNELDPDKMPWEEYSAALTDDELEAMRVYIRTFAEDDGDDVHTLGYFMNIHEPVFQEQLARFRDDRLQRARRVVEKLAELGLPMEWEQVRAMTDSGSVGRAHIARAMVEAGFVGSVKEAFDRYLQVGGPAYVARRRLSPEEAIELIHRAGGVAVLARGIAVPEPVERQVVSGVRW